MRSLVATVLSTLLFAVGNAAAQTGSSNPTTLGAFAVGAEVLGWWFKKSPTPVPIITDGFYGEPDTAVLLGGGGLDTNPNPGFRLSADHRVNERWSIEGNFLYVGQRSTTRSVASSGLAGSVDLRLPFVDAINHGENVAEISLAPLYAGIASVELTNSLMGAEANAAWAIASQRPFDMGLLAGFRWLRLKETYTISTSSPSIPPQPVDIWNTTDRFDASNDFYGAQLGGRGRYDGDRWFVGGLLKVGVGAVVQSVDISGSLVTNDFTSQGATQPFAGGYFALPTNSGGHSQTVFAVVPEVQLTAGYRITPSASIFAGYSFLYASSVVRPGNEINRNINPTQSVSYVGAPPVALQGPAQPSFNFNTSTFWAQGVSLGLRVGF